MSRLIVLIDVHNRRIVVDVEKFSNYLRMGRGRDRYQIEFTDGHNVTVNYVQLMRLFKYRMARHFNTN